MREPGKFNIGREKHLVLISPLDWGLGHTTRCIPLIRELIQLSCEVIVACNPAQKALLLKEFPDLSYHFLPGYAVQYGKSRFHTLLQLCRQIPKILKAIKREQRWLQKFLEKHPVDLIISDNRYGFFASGVSSVLITHQPGVISGAGALITTLMRRFIKKKIENFDECWIPDQAGSASIAGILSNPDFSPEVPLRYLGCISRLEPCVEPQSGSALLVIISGPEPQRSLFEKLVLDQLARHELKATLVRGLPENTAPFSKPNLIIYNHVDSVHLNQLICNAEWVICRSGYTSIMDLLKLGKKMILVPTPGQAEQEYLAQRMQEKKRAICFEQDRFSIPEALNKAIQFSYSNSGLDMDTYKTELKNFISKLRPGVNAELQSE